MAASIELQGQLSCAPAIRAVWWAQLPAQARSEIDPTAKVIQLGNLKQQQVGTRALSRILSRMSFRLNDPDPDAGLKTSTGLAVVQASGAIRFDTGNAITALGRSHPV
jgi:hypothetical protein